MAVACDTYVSKCLTSHEFFMKCGIMCVCSTSGLNFSSGKKRFRGRKLYRDFAYITLRKQEWDEKALTDKTKNTNIKRIIQHVSNPLFYSLKSTT